MSDLLEEEVCECKKLRKRNRKLEKKVVRLQLRLDQVGLQVITLEKERKDYLDEIFFLKSNAIALQQAHLEDDQQNSTQSTQNLVATSDLQNTKPTSRKKSKFIKTTTTSSKDDDRKNELILKTNVKEEYGPSRSCDTTLSNSILSNKSTTSSIKQKESVISTSQETSADTHHYQDYQNQNNNIHHNNKQVIDGHDASLAITRNNKEELISLESRPSLELAYDVVLPKYMETDSSDQYEETSRSSRNMSPKKVHEMLSRLNETELPEEFLEHLPQLFCDEDPILDRFMKAQKSQTGPGGSFDGLFELSALSQLIDFSQLYPPRCPAFDRQGQRFKIKNISKSPIQVSISTYASSGSFLGLDLTKSLIAPEGDSRFVLTLVGLAPKSTCCLSVLTVQSCTLDAENNPVFTKRVLFGSRTTFSTKVDCPFWKIDLTNLIPDSAPALANSAHSFINGASLFGVKVSCKTFKQHQSLSDFFAFQKELEKYNNPKLFHPNLASMIGASDKRPFRIITQEWTSTISTSLLALRQSLDSATVSTKAPTSIISTTFPELVELPHRILISHGIFSGLQHLHSCNLVHKDLSSHTTAITNLKHGVIWELGSIDEIQGTGSSSIQSSRSCGWIAPEVISRNAYSRESDIFSFGILLLELCIGIPATALPTKTMTFENFYQTHLPNLCSGNSVMIPESANLIGGEVKVLKPLLKQGDLLPAQILQNLIGLCCQPNPSLRATPNIIIQELERAFIACEVLEREDVDE